MKKLMITIFIGLSSIQYVKAQENNDLLVESTACTLSYDGKMLKHTNTIINFDYSLLKLDYPESMKFGLICIQKTEEGSSKILDGGRSDKTDLNEKMISVLKSKNITKIYFEQITCNENGIKSPKGTISIALK